MRSAFAINKFDDFHTEPMMYPLPINTYVVENNETGGHHDECHVAADGEKGTF